MDLEKDLVPSSATRIFFVIQANISLHVLTMPQAIIVAWESLLEIPETAVGKSLSSSVQFS